MIQLSDHFSYRKLIRFTLPSIGMMLVTMTYSIVDGLYVSNVVGPNAFASVNLIMPYSMLIGAVGFMIGTGGSALVAKLLGEGDAKRANEHFTMLVTLLAIIGVIIAGISAACVEPIARLLGANETLLADCVTYGRILILFLPAFMLQTTFQSFLVTAEKPTMSLVLSIASGVTNIVLDGIFMIPLKWGITGAAVATGISQLVGAVIPLVYFSRKNDSTLRFCKFKWDWRAIGLSCGNGSSEMMTNLSASLVNMLYNFQLMKRIGVDGVSAYGVIMYIMMIFQAAFMGYGIGSAPVVSYHYGAGHRDELKSLFRKSHVLLGGTAIVMTLLSEILTAPLSRLFVGYDEELLSLTMHAMRLYSISYLFCWFNMYASSFFTALNDGLRSALISFLRTLLFQVVSVLTLPLILGVDGIWLAVVAAELLTAIVSVSLYLTAKDRYGYM